jgi:hypothetical protein
MAVRSSKALDRGASAGEVSFENTCPTCEQPIAYEQAEKIRRRIELKERRDAEEVEARIATERDLARHEATAAATKAMEAKLAEADQRRTDAEAEVVVLRENQESALAAARHEATAAATKAMEAKLAEADQRRTDAEAEVVVLRENHEADLAQRVAEVRDAYEADKDKAVNKAKAESFEREQKLHEELARVNRLLERKTSTELGEGAEVDLFESLRVDFPDDKIRRVPKGEPGADIVHEIFENGSRCGSILWDSKNRSRWLNEYVEKLRKDQLAERADAAVLTTSKFPRGERQLCVQDGVIITNPARAVVVAHIIRKFIVSIHSLRLSNDGREQKMAQLYELITSQQVSERFDRMETINTRLLDLDVKEKKAHDKVWTDRGALLRDSQRVLSELTCDIERVVGKTEADGEATA